MYFVQFTAPRVKEYPQAQEFESRVRRFIATRETENNYMLALTPRLLQGTVNAIMFTVEEEGTVAAAGLYLVGGNTLVTTWGAHDVLDAIVDHAVKSRWNITEIFGPAHCSYFLGKSLSQRTNQKFELDRAERAYQLTRSSYPLPDDGQLQVAVEADVPLVQRWLHGFITEANYENDGRTLEQMASEMVRDRLIYLWKAPRAVSMAGWVCPTPSGASINYVYTPPELRGRGYAKAVTAALAGQMLASGLKYVAIRTDCDDAQTNAMYQAIGAQSVCEFVRCRIKPISPERPPEFTSKAKPLVML